MTRIRPVDETDRRTYLGSTDIKRLMDGDHATLWLEKTGRQAGEDLSDNFQVQLGIYTEPFNLDWFERTTGVKLLRNKVTKGRSSLFQHIEHEDAPIASHPDGVINLEIDELIEGRRTASGIVECKHTGSFTGADDIFDRYFWQAQTHMAVWSAGRTDMSVIYGNEYRPPVPIDRDEDAVAKLLDAAAKFWWHVVNDKEIRGSAAPGAVAAPLRHRVVDMLDGNRKGEWADAVAEWNLHRDPAKRFDAAEKTLKDMVPDDASAAHGAGLIVTIAANGRKSIKPLDGKTAAKFRIPFTPGLGGAQ